ncbi:hypothetical protein [Ralstonia solanacearum]|uniref:hypothetical protein n=1 Tax=Ralstonia solanacearum TaxID=305 RepID=UPI000B32F4BA|nr:hypothetical protein [Ralstonia solanacearum]
MKRLLMKLFGRAEPAPAPAPDPVPVPTAVAMPTPRKPGGKRKYSSGKRRRPAPPGAVRIDHNGNLLEQARQAGGIKR